MVQARAERSRDGAAPRRGGEGLQAPPDGRRAERWIVGMLLAFALLLMTAAAVSGVDELRRQLAKIDLALLATMLVLSLGSFALRFLRWQICSVSVGVNVPIKDQALFFLAGFSMTVTPGKVGEILRLWLLRRSYGYRYEATAPILLVDRLSDVGGIALVGCLGAVALGAYREASLFVLAVALAANAAFLRPRWCLLLVTLCYGLLRRFPRLFARVRIMLRRIERVSSLRTYGPILLLSVAGWSLESASLYLLLDRLGADIPLAAAMVVFCLSILLGVATMLPGGIGGAELGIVGLLIALGVAESNAVVAAGIIRVTTLWFAVLLGVLSLGPAMRRAGQLGRRAPVRPG